MQEPVSEYRKWLELSKSKHTASAYLGTVAKFLGWLNKPLDEATDRDVTNYMYSLRGRCNERSISRHAYALRSFFEWAGKVELARRIPIPPSWVITPPKWLEEEEVDRIISSARSLRDEALLQTAYDLALRVSEVCSLNRDSFDPSAKVMEVVRMKRKGLMRDVLPLEDETVRLLKAYLSSRSDDDEALFVARSASGISRISHDAVNYAFKAACKAAGIEGVRFHTLRHSRLTHLAIKGADIITIAKYAGHSNVNSTLVYIHLAAEYLRKRMERPKAVSQR